MTAGLCAERLLVSRRGRTQEIALQPAREAPWRAAVDALPAALGAPPGRRAAALTVVLSHEFVHYALLPWNEALRSQEAWLAYARHRLAAIHGAAAAEWALRVTSTAPRGARIACAIDPALLEALRAGLAGTGARLDSVQPHLMAAFNGARRRLRGASCWLVVAEAGRLVLALLERGAWRSLRCRRLQAPWRDALPELLEREGALLGLGEAPAPFVASALG